MRAIGNAATDDANVDVLDELLAEARSAGNAAAEIDALRRVGQWHLRRGDTRGAGERLRQAEAVALSVGDRYLQREVSASLLAVDSWRGDLDAVDRRIRNLKTAVLQGSLAFNVGMAGALVFVIWLIAQSIYVLGTLCPWCMLVWSVTIPLFWVVTFRNAAEGVFGDRLRHAGDALMPWIVPVTVASYVVVAVLAQLRLDLLRAFFG